MHFPYGLAQSVIGMQDYLSESVFGLSRDKGDM